LLSGGPVVQGGLAEQQRHQVRWCPRGLGAGR
jgi:hypothetical protein